VRQRIVESRNLLFEDPEPIRALKDFLARAVAEA
jgi:hypothetical protein